MLFNVFVDNLLCRLNDGTTTIPRALFYADDRVLVIPPRGDIAALINVVVEWYAANRIELNVAKCGYLTDRRDLQPFEI